MKKIEIIWEDLEENSSNNSGLLYKRYSAEFSSDIFIALKAPEKLRCVAFRISNSLSFDENQWNKLKDIKIETLPDESGETNKFLLVVLLNKQHKDIFSTLCEDLIFGTSSITIEADLIKTIIQRLEKWQLLFEKIGQQGLSNEAQRGLYGELFFLRKFLKVNSSIDYCINSWRGTEKAVQDFQFSNWAVEIKTTHGKNQQKLHISSERQLDISIIPRIFLIHYSLEVRQNHGESLNEIIDDLLDFISQSPSAHSIFQLKLFEAGFFDVHRHLYAEIGYSIRQETIYQIAEDFPRITEAQIQPGIGDVRYSLIVSANPDWNIDEEALFENLKTEE